MGGAGVKPDVEGVAARGQLGGCRPGGRQFHAREQVGRGGIEPEVGSAGFELVGDAANHAGVEIGLLPRIVECRDGHAP